MDTKTLPKQAQCVLSEPLLQYICFLLLREIEPNRDHFLVEPMQRFFARFRWAYETQTPNDRLRSALQADTKRTGWTDLPGYSELTELLGEEPGDVCWEVTNEILDAPFQLQVLLKDTTALFKLARTLGYLATVPGHCDGFSDAEIEDAFRTVNQIGGRVEPSAVPSLLEQLGFLSAPRDGVRDVTERFSDNRLLFAAFAACRAYSYWTIVEKKEPYDVIREHFPEKLARDRLSLLCKPETTERLLLPLLLIAEHRPTELMSEDRKILFDYMVQTLQWEPREFALRIADALFAEELTAYEADWFMETASDECPEALTERIDRSFRSSVNDPKCYYPYALQIICGDEPAFAISLAQDLARCEERYSKVLGYAILGTLAKATLEQWGLPDIAHDTVTDERIVNELLQLAASPKPGQGFYQKMLSNLVCAGYIPSTATCPQNPAYPKQYRDLWLAEGMRSAVGFYPREFECLSNYSPFAIRYDGELYQTAETAYQARKFYYTNPEIEEQIRLAPSPWEAKRIAEENRAFCRPDWEELKLLIMEDILRVKLFQHPFVREKLLATGDMPIVDDSPSDPFWGVGFDRRGRNELGKLWMKLRSMLQNQDSTFWENSKPNQAEP